MIWLFNIFVEFFNSFFKQHDGIKNIYLVGKNKQLLTFNGLQESYDHVEIEYTLNNKNFIHVLPNFHQDNHDTPIVILSAILNDRIDITEYVEQYLINDLNYLQIKHIIPPKYLSTFETLEILDVDCNSLIYRKLNSNLGFLQSSNPSSTLERRNSFNEL